MGSLALLVCTWAARAAEPPPPPPPARLGGEKRPLAIPADEAPGEPPPAIRPPPYDAVTARALRDYRSQYLSIRPQNEIVVGSTWTYGWSAGFGTAGMGAGVGLSGSPTPYIDQNQSISVYQGQRSIDVPATFVALGDPAGAKKLESKIRGNRTSAGFLYALGVAGIAASIGGLIAAENAENPHEAQQWTTVSWVGVGATTVGFIGGSLPSARARRLQTDPTATFDLDVLQERIDRRNDALAAELGLTPAQAVGLENP